MIRRPYFVVFIASSASDTMTQEEPMATITPEQRQEIEQSGEHPVKVLDPDNNHEHVIISGELHQSMRSLLEIDHVDRSLYEFGDFYPLKK
jgi:hypothetical protein